jgi:hypothetical protein
VGEDVAVPHAAVATQGRPLQVWPCMQSPPLDAEVGQQLIAGVEVDRIAPLMRSWAIPSRYRWPRPESSLFPWGAPQQIG